MRASSYGAAGAGVVGQRVGEQARRRASSGVGGHRAAVGDGGQRPRPAGGVGEPGELLDPAAGQVGFAGADGGVDALGRGHPGQDGQAQPGEVVQRAEGVARGCRVRALGPPGQVVDRVGQDAQRVAGDDLLEVGQAGCRSRRGPGGRRAG